MHGMDVYPDGILLLEKIPEAVALTFCCVVFYDDMMHIKIFLFLANCALFLSICTCTEGTSFGISCTVFYMITSNATVWLVRSGWLSVGFFFSVCSFPALLSYYILIALLWREALGVYGSREYCYWLIISQVTLISLRLL